MIIGIGIDSVEIERFKDWYNYSKIQLRKIFSDEEIEYCLSNKIKSPERFAVRFAVKEAAYKSIQDLNSGLSFFNFCKIAEIEKNEHGKPNLKINWNRDLKVLVSCTHTQKIASAIVILAKN